MKKWIVNKPDKDLSQRIASSCGVTTLCADVLVSRGVTSPQQALEQFNIDSLSDPFLLRDMRETVEIINNAIDDFNSICIFGDYDCDGICSTAMLFSYLDYMGANVSYILPERDEGYGLNENTVRQMHEQGVELIITVDNGISAHTEAELIYELGMKLIITDHHQPSEILPKAEAIVNPQRADCPSPFKPLCGAGVVLKLIAALENGNYETAINEYGELAAIATIADVVSLTGENRYIATMGIRLMENSERVGINALISKSSIKFPLTSTSIAFGIAPRINASGRFGSPSLAARLLLTDDETEAHMLSEELEILNTQRKNSEQKIIDDIENIIMKNPKCTIERVLVLSGENWHHGIIGIVSARMLEKFSKPTFIITIEGDIARGSARSFGSFSAFKALEYCSELLERFGGHMGAGGFTLKTENIPLFNEKIQQYAKENFEHMLIPDITADKLISTSEITIDNAKSLQVLEPFGEKNSQPIFAMLGAEVVEIAPLSNGLHTKLKLNLQGKTLETLFFRHSPKSLFLKLSDKVDIMFTMEVQTYLERESIKILIKDLRKCGIEQKKYFAAKDAYEKYCRNELLPSAYYAKIIPERKELITVYQKLVAENHNADTLYTSIMSSFNYCKMMVCVDVFNELGLIAKNPFSKEIRVIKNAPKANLDDSLILNDLKAKVNREVIV